MTLAAKPPAFGPDRQGDLLQQSGALSRAETWLSRGEVVQHDSRFPGGEIAAKFNLAKFLDNTKLSSHTAPKPYTTVTPRDITMEHTLEVVRWRLVLFGLRT